MKKIVLVSLVCLITACVSYQLPPSRVETSATTYQGESHAERGTIVVMPIDKVQQNSLEFKTVGAHVLKKLEQNGYIVGNEKSAEFQVFITYGIDSGTTTSTVVPIYGSTGGGSKYTSGTITSGTSVANYSASTWSMPTYGVVGAATVKGTEYKRAVNIDIFKVVQKKDPHKVYELRGYSIGSCGNVNSVILTIVDGMFVNFPGVNGVTKKVSIDWFGDC